MDPARLCGALLEAESESRVVDILIATSLWEDPRAWRDFGDQENNFSTIGNQQASAEAALVEKLVNSIDAVLTLECCLQGIDPEGVQAPRTVSEAVSRFFGIKDGNLSEPTPTELTQLAGRIGLVASGSKRAPNLTIIDSGEGQSPDQFPETFLSIGKSNKLKIPFVQGKFNMGGTGVLQFCGRHNLQLVVSRRHPNLAPADEAWGFTIVRRDDPAGNVKSSVYRYLAPGGRVPSFRQDGGLNVRLDGGKSGMAELPTLDFGSIIKLFDYQLPGGAKTNILFDLFNDLSCLMPGVALPIRFFERRDYAGHSFESNMVGLGARLERDTADNLEFVPTSHILLPDTLRLPARVYAFRRKPDGSSASEKFRGREGVLFVVNGQAHGSLDKLFFKRSKVGLSWVADDLLVLVDATRLPGRDREDLFMNSRDRLRDGEMKRDIEGALEECLHTHELLRELNDRRRTLALGKKLEQDSALADMLKDIVMRSPVLAALLVTGQRIPDAEHMRPAAPSRLDNFPNLTFPTYFVLMKGNDRRVAHLGQRFKVQLETDVENRFFDRQIEPGTVTLRCDGQQVGCDPPNLMNGIGTLNLALPAWAKEGSALSYELDIDSPGNVVEPFHLQFERIVEGPIITKGTTGGRKSPADPDEAGDRQTPSSRGLPEIVTVRRPDWGLYNFDAESALLVRESGSESYDFFVNLDNKYLQAEVRNRRGQRESLEAQFKYGLALFGLAALQFRRDHPEDSEGNPDSEQFIRGLSEAFAPFLIPMVDGLSTLALAPEPPDESDT